METSGKVSGTLTESEVVFADRNLLEVQLQLGVAMVMLTAHG